MKGNTMHGYTIFRIIPFIGPWAWSSIYNQTHYTRISMIIDFWPWCVPCFFILDGCSFYYAHIWSKSGISICWRHLVTSEESSNQIFFRGKKTFFHHTCSCSELPSYISTMMQPDWNVKFSLQLFLAEGSRAFSEG